MAKAIEEATEEAIEEATEGVVDGSAEIIQKIVDPAEIGSVQVSEVLMHFL